MPRRLVVLALLLLPLAYVPVHAHATSGEGVGPARHSFRPAILPVGNESQVIQPPWLSVIVDSCADGTVAHDETGGAANVVLPNLQVQLWDKDSSSPDDLLDADLTNASGGFLLCAPSDDPDDAANDGLDLYVRLVAENGFWRVQDSEAYRFDLPLNPNVAPGTTIHYGVSKPDSGAFQIFNAMDRMYAWTAAQDVNDCWDAEDHNAPDDYTKCRQVVIDWRADSTTQSFYDSALNKVYLSGPDFKWRDAVVRTAAKAVMDDLFEDDFPDTQDCGTQIGELTTVNCAWVNGFGDWVATQVFADPVLDFQVGTTVFHENLESPSWDTAGWDRGPAVEGRVAGALLDISDSTNEGPWDRVAFGPGYVWTKLLAYSWLHRYSDFEDLAFGGDGQLSTLYQNTIDFGLRDPLTNAAVYLRRTPEPPQNFRYTTTSQAWSVMAIRPPLGADYDLKLYGTSDLSGSPLAQSATGSNTPDLVVVDSNPGRKPLGTFYPQVYRFSASSGDYDLKYVQAAFTAGIGQNVSTTMTAGNPVAIWETSIAANAAVKFELNQPLGTNAELFLFCDTASSSTWVRGRAGATATAPQVAGLETLLWTAPATAPGTCAVVLINKSGAGTYTVIRKS